MTAAMGGSAQTGEIVDERRHARGTHKESSSLLQDSQGNFHGSDSASASGAHL